MNLDYTNPGEVKISLIDYLTEAIAGFPKEISGSISSLAADHLSTTNKDCEMLDETRARIFHDLAVKLLWTCKRGRPDIQTTASFLTT